MSLISQVRPSVSPSAPRPKRRLSRDLLRLLRSIGTTPEHYLIARDVERCLNDDGACWYAEVADSTDGSTTATLWFHHDPRPFDLRDPFIGVANHLRQMSIDCVRAADRLEVAQ